MARNILLKDGKIINIEKKGIKRKILRFVKKTTNFDKIRKWVLRKRYKLYMPALNVEFTSCCNLRCRMCITAHGFPPERRGFMDLNFFKRLVDLIYDDNNVCIEYFGLWLGGELLLHPKFTEFLFYLGEKRKETKKKVPYVRMLTNATLLQGKKMHSIIDSQAVDEVFFSVDCGKKEDFEYMRTGAKWDEILGNINQFIELNNAQKKRIITGIHSIIRLDEGNYDKEFLNLIKKIDFFHPRMAHNWNGHRELELGRYEDNNISRNTGLCGGVQVGFCVTWDGLAVPCCGDLMAQCVIGDLNKENLYDIYYGDKRKQLISALKNNRRDMIELCKNCAS